MTKDEFAEKLAGKADIPKSKAHEVIDAIFSTEPGKGIVAVELDAGRDFTITGFGTFYTRQRASRQGRNPKTGERKSLRSIAAELANLGHVNVNGRPFAAQSIQAMIRQR